MLSKNTKMPLAVATLCVCMVPTSGPAMADAVLEWNEIAEQVSTVWNPAIRTYHTAMAHLAIHDALNSIEPRYAAYTSVPSASPTASPDAAVAAAAYFVLVQTAPSMAANLSVIYNDWIAALPACPAVNPSCIQEGIAAGTAAASALLVMRAGDASVTPSLPYVFTPGPGVYEPTPPALPPPQFAGWANLTPFALRSASQFRSDAGDLFHLGSEEYARDYNEVKRVGAQNAEATGNRTPDQSEVARFWPSGGASWNSVMRVIVDGRGLGLWEHARLFALLNVAMSDSAVTVFDTKYHYNFWRPVTAIRAGDTDGNPATDADPGWLPFLPTPPYPDYTCGLTNAVGAAVEVTRRFFGTDDIPFTFTAFDVFISPGEPMTRSYNSLSQAAAEAVDARVYGGMHFREGCVKGVRQGEKVGRFAIVHTLKPLKGQHK